MILRRTEGFCRAEPPLSLRPNAAFPQIHHARRRAAGPESSLSVSGRRAAPGRRSADACGRADRGRGRKPIGPAPLDLGNVALLPGLINAHTHLEFSDLSSPLGTAGNRLPDWIRQVMAHRHAANRGPASPASGDPRPAGLAECASRRRHHGGRNRHAILVQRPKTSSPAAGRRHRVLGGDRPPARAIRRAIGRGRGTSPSGLAGQRVCLARPQPPRPLQRRSRFARSGAPPGHDRQCSGRDASGRIARRAGAFGRRQRAVSRIAHRAGRLVARRFPWWPPAARLSAAFGPGPAGWPFTAITWTAKRSNFWPPTARKCRSSFVRGLTPFLPTKVIRWRRCSLAA